MPSRLAKHPSLIQVCYTHRQYTLDLHTYPNLPGLLDQSSGTANRLTLTAYIQILLRAEIPYHFTPAEIVLAAKSPQRKVVAHIRNVARYSKISKPTCSLIWSNVPKNARFEHAIIISRDLLGNMTRTAIR